jgi:hypothetical protein
MPRKARSTDAPAPTPTAVQPAPEGQPFRLSPTAQALFDEIASQWELTPPVRALLRLGCEAMSKAEQCEAITAREGLTIGDQKGASKPHPASLLARDYRAQAQMAIQRLLSALGK